MTNFKVSDSMVYSNFMVDLRRLSQRVLVGAGRELGGDLSAAIEADRLSETQDAEDSQQGVVAPPYCLVENSMRDIAKNFQTCWPKEQLKESCRAYVFMF